ncbi:MAG TPA: protein kinase [Polyangiales bacterium]|nr:protein kinase [Polyangiales bacterium]
MTLPSIGDVVDDKFRIERKLGEGGTSTIYEVRHAITDKRFAIKWLSPDLAKNDLAVQLLVHEAKVCGRFVHPNAVQIYDICRTEESYYLLMEFLEGESLETRLHREQRMSPQAACDILLPCMEALSAAHRVGIVHRDLKPSNIFLCRIEGRTEELPKVLDFGISNFLHNGIEISPNTAGSGTPLYMAPEQMQAQPAEPRFDIYALGVVLYELVSGQPPFDSDDFDDLVHRVVESQPTQLDHLVQVDPVFAKIVARAMARGVEDRFASMDEFAAALRPYSSYRSNSSLSPKSPSQPPTQVQPRRSEPSRPPGRRSSWAQTSQGFMLQQHFLSPHAAEAKSALAALIDVAPPAASVADSERTLEDLAVIGAVALDPEPAVLKPLAAAPAPVAKPRELKDTKPIMLAARVAKAKLEASRKKDVAAVASAEAPAPAPAPVSAVDADVETSRPITVLPPAASTSAPPIVLPPSRAAAFSVNHEIFWKDEAFGDDTPLSADDMPRMPRARRKRQIGLVAALGGALVITLYTLARSPQNPAESTVARTTSRSLDADRSPVTAASPAVAVATPVPVPAEPMRVFEPEARVAPKLEPTAESVVAAKTASASADAQSIRQARRAARAAAQAKRAAAASDSPKPSKRVASAEGNARAERGAGESGRPGLAMPAAYVSRQDF